MLSQRETEIELGSLLRQDFQGLHNELLLRLGEHYQQVHTSTLAQVEILVVLECMHVSNEFTSVLYHCRYSMVWQFWLPLHPMMTRTRVPETSPPQSAWYESEFIQCYSFITCFD